MRAGLSCLFALSSGIALVSCSSEHAGLPPDGINCTADSQCSGTKPYCDKTSGKCVECLLSPDACPAGSHCALVAGVLMCSSACRDDADCAATGGGAAHTCCGGACLDSSADGQNCGACGMVCAPPSNAAALCASGHCGLGDCNAGFGDCDKDPANGCETSTASDSMNCGTCGIVCPPGVNGTISCQMGACASTCNAGFLHCSANPADGCEVDGTRDPMNCGACGKACPVGNLCILGQCQLQLVSDASWKLAQNAPMGWEQPGFNDAQWAAATDEGEYGVAPWGKFAAFDPLNTPAHWLWYYVSNTGNDMSTVYFRHSFVASAAAATLTLSCDNTFVAYLDGMMVGTGNDWTKPQQMQMNLTPGQTYVIAITITNEGGPGGLLADMR